MRVSQLLGIYSGGTLDAPYIMFSRGRTVHWNTTDSVDELRRLVYNVLFDVRGRAEGYDNVRDILRDLG